jgi:thioredoxin 1
VHLPSSIVLAAAVLALATVPGTSTATAPDAKVASAPTARQALRPRLVFFMNPNGQPCQIQDRILREMAGELSGKTDVVYYRTTSGEDLQRFQQYGIRSLPTLLLTDASGKEIRRATPGIQSAAQVRQLVAP